MIAKTSLGKTGTTPHSIPQAARNFIPNPPPRKPGQGKPAVDSARGEAFNPSGDAEEMMQIMIAQPVSGLGPESDGPAAPRAATIAFGLGNLPPTALLLLAIVSVQLGGALAALIYPNLGPVGVTFASAGFSALMLTLFGRPKPWFRGSGALLRRHAKLILAFGAVEVMLLLPYYLALERIPLGILATITFLGPLGLAVATSRRVIHFVWIAIAGFGILLLTPEVGTAIGGLDPVGLIEGAIAGIAWAAFVPVSKRVGAVIPGTDGLALALWLCAIATLPLAFIEGSLLHAGLFGLAGAFCVSLLGLLLPTLLEYRALQRMSARTYGILVTLEPAAGALVGVICLDQPVSTRMIAAVGCVMLAALGVTLSDRHEQ
jgi:inner membrane transporter RhtA